MSSPFRPSDRSPLSQRSTPSRSLPGSSKRKNGFHKSMRDSVNGDSPSRQFIEDFGKMLINDDKNFKRSLDEQTAMQQRLHMDALDRALAKHQEVRDSAERIRERIELEELQARQRKEAEERRALEKARQELAEQQRRQKLEEERAREEERKRQEAIRREDEETRRKAAAQKQREEEEKTRKDREAKEDADRRVRQDAETKQRQQQAEQERQKAAQQPPQANGTSSLSSIAPRQSTTAPPAQATSASAAIPSGILSSPDEREAVHKKYVALHKKLKTMRQGVLAQAKDIPGLKNQVSDWRREIQKCCGQLGKGGSEEIKATNKQATAKIMVVLDAASQVSTPSIDITEYLVENAQPAGATKQGPGVLLFLLNQFAKKIVSQFISEAGVDPDTADVIGILAVTIFARPKYHFNGQSLIDVLWAKFHKTCPVLFGINGSEKTKEGRLKLGWHIENGAFVGDQTHYERNSGLGAGFAAMGLRDFSKSRNQNPVPNRFYWEAMARILNNPAEQVQSTHCVILKAMINNSVPRILTTFGGAGLALLRQALVSFPREKGPVDANGKKVPAVQALESMVMLLQMNQHLTL